MAQKKISSEAQAIISASDARWYVTTVGLTEKFLVTHPDSQRAWLDLGHALGQLARYDAAEHAFQRALELAGEGPQDVIFGEFGNLFRAKGDFESAMRWYRKQIDADPSDATGYLFLGNVMMKRGEFEAAEAILMEGLTCSQGCLEEVNYSIGLLKRSLGELQEASRYFSMALGMDDKFVAAKIALKDVKTALSQR